MVTKVIFSFFFFFYPLSCFVRLCLHRRYRSCAKAAGPPSSGPAGAGVSAAARRPSASGTSPFNTAPPPTNCWPRSYHVLQHQDPWRSTHAQTISGDARSHDGFTLEQKQQQQQQQQQKKKECNKRFTLTQT